MVFQGISPTFWGTITDSYGRRHILLFSMVLYCGACIDLALSPNYAALIVFRIIQTFRSSAVIAVPAGVLSDITQAKE
jgi:MFS family permease